MKYIQKYYQKTKKKKDESIETTIVRSFAQDKKIWESHWDSDTMDVAKTFTRREP